MIPHGVAGIKFVQRSYQEIIRALCGLKNFGWDVPKRRKKKRRAKR